MLQLVCKLLCLFLRHSLYEKRGSGLLSFRRSRVKSPALASFLEPFKVAAAEGAVVELKLRLLAGKVPALQKYVHQKKLQDIEDDLAKHFGDALSDDGKETLSLCRQLRNKVLASFARTSALQSETIFQLRRNRQVSP
jgi:hypothetical protein